MISTSSFSFLICINISYAYLKTKISHNYAKIKYNIEFKNPEKIVVIGNMIFEDVLFGKWNNLPTIYVTGLN